jgi:hypothetical protein
MPVFFYAEKDGDAGVEDAGFAFGVCGVEVGWGGGRVGGWWWEDLGWMDIMGYG